jgi:hypothetical protein
MKVVAMVLLLAFCQRLGASLWVHHFYHENRANAAADKPGMPYWETRCDCLDDAFMPLEVAQVFHLPLISPGYVTVAPAPFSTLLHRSQLHSSLRGPPASTRLS